MRIALESVQGVDDKEAGLGSLQGVFEHGRARFQVPGAVIWECEWSFPKAVIVVGILLRGGENVTALGFLREYRRGTPACPEDS